METKDHVFAVMGIDECGLMSITQCAETGQLMLYRSRDEAEAANEEDDQSEDPNAKYVVVQVAVTYQVLDL